MLVGDIYGGRDYSSIGLSASTIACSFGKVVGQDKELQDYNPADVAMSLCRCVSHTLYMFYLPICYDNLTNRPNQKQTTMNLAGMLCAQVEY